MSNHDEKAYLEEAGKTFAGLTTFDQLLVNLTDMPDEELQYWRERGRREILRHHLLRHPIRYPLQLVHDGINYLRRHGIRQTWRHIPETIRKHWPEASPYYLPAGAAHE